MTRLVVFGCGYVGLELLGQAQQRGWAVEALTRNEKAAEKAAARGAKVTVAELASTAWHSAIDPEVTAAVCCVGAADLTPAGYRASYLDGQRSIFRWASAGRGQARYVYTSSTRVYPQTDGSTVVEADAAAADMLDPNGQIVRESEMLALAAPGFAGHTVLRLAGIYGPGRHRLLDTLRAGKAVFPGSGSHFLNLLHRSDIVSGVLAALTASPEEAEGVFNLADGAPLRQRELVEWLAAELQMPAPLFDPKAISPRARRRGAHYQWPDRIVSSAKARNVLGWEQVFSDARAGYRSLLDAVAQK